MILNAITRKKGDISPQVCLEYNNSFLKNYIYYPLIEAPVNTEAKVPVITFAGCGS